MIQQFQQGDQVFWTSDAGDLYVGTLTNTPYPQALLAHVDDRYVAPVAWMGRTREEAIAKRVAYFEACIAKLRAA